MSEQWPSDSLWPSYSEVTVPVRDAYGQRRYWRAWRTRCPQCGLLTMILGTNSDVYVALVVQLRCERCQAEYMLIPNYSPN